MRKIEPELITGMGYIGDNPGVLYRMGGAGEQTVVTGNPALLEGVKGSRFTSLTLHGKSSQGSTTGAQLFDKSKAFAGWVNSDGSINNAGTVGKGDNIVSEYIPFEAGKQYFCGSDFVWIYNTEKGFVKKADTELKGGVFTSPDNAGFFVVAFSVSAEKALAKSNEIMINVGSVKKPYEPYTGGAPSPSPSYPQEIESAGQSGEISVDVYGGNLFDKSTAIFGWIVDKNNGNIARNERYACSDYIAIPRGISFLYQTGGSLNQRAFYDAGKIYISAAGSANKTYIPTNARYIRITSAIDKQDMSDIILNIGSTALTYEPYKPAQKLIIPTPNGLPGIPVSSGGNYTDEKGQQWVADEIDLARGERVQQTIKVVLDGSRKIIIQKHQGFNRFVIGESDFPIPSGYAAFCSHFIVNPSPVQINTVDGTICVYSNGNVYLRSDRFTNADELKAFLKENPVTLEYCLAEPIRTPLPPEIIAAYKALHTYSPTTTVINDAGAGMSVGYKRK